MTRAAYRRYRFFKEHAGYVVGERALGAVHLARAEEIALWLGYVVIWEPDDDPDLGDHAYWCAEERRHAAGYGADGEPVARFGRDWFRDHSHEVEIATLIDERGEVLASLGGIIDADCDYRRVIMAELANEALGNVATINVA